MAKSKTKSVRMRLVRRMRVPRIWRSFATSMPSGSGGNIAPYAARRDRGLATCFGVPLLCPTWPPLFLSDLPRRLPAMRGGFFSPSLEAACCCSSCPCSIDAGVPRSSRVARRSLDATPHTHPNPTHAEATRSLAQRHRGRLQARRLGKQNRELIPNILSQSTRNPPMRWRLLAGCSPACSGAARSASSPARCKRTASR